MEKIKLDLIPSGKMPSLHASQYDDGREHGIDLFENGVAYNLDGTETLTINERKGDDCICSLDIENTFADSNHIVFASTEQMCAVWGNNICELVISKGEKTIGTLNFILEIEQSPTEGGIESESEIKNLERQIEAITEEVIGDNYYTAEETDEAIATATEGKADKTYVDTELAKKADKNNTYTKTEVDTLIDNLPEPMIFKGTLGVGGTIQTLPTASASNEGWTFKCITAGTYEGLTLKVGDTVTCFNPPNTSNYYWDKTGSQDTDTDTWRAIKVNGTEELGSGISSGSVDFVGSENIDVEFDSNGNKVGVKTKNIYTKTEVDNIVSDAIYNILPSELTPKGAVANFSTTLEMPIKSLDVDVNAKQDLHGQSSPYPAGGSAQIWNEEWEVGIWNSSGQKSDSQNAIRCKNYIKINPSETYYVFANFTRYATGIILRLLDANKSFVRTVVVNSSSTKTFTADSNVEYVVWCSSSTDQITTYNNDVSINYPATDTAYHPYSNICPISGVSEISVAKAGANLWNTEWEVGGISNTTGENENATSYWRTVGYIPIKPNTAYFISSLTGADGNAIRVRFYGADKSFVGSSVKSGYGAINRSFVSPDNASFLRFSPSNSNCPNHDISINYPSTDTTYHNTYNGNTEVINLGGTYYGGHFTQDKDGHRQFIVESIGKRINEFNNWQYLGGYNYFECTVENMKKSATTSVLNGLICECYATRTAQQAGSGNVDGSIAGWAYTTTNETRLRIKDNDFNNVSNWLSSMGNYLVVYPLATPIIIDLPDGEPIATLIGTNNIFADSGDTSVVFKDSVNGYVEKKIVSVQALALNT